MKFLQTFFSNFFKKINAGFLLCILCLQALGLLSLYSAAYGSEGEGLLLFRQQLVWILLGWMVFFVFYHSKLSWMARLAPTLFIINMIGLALVPLLGKEIYGVKRWLDLGPFHYQPSETLKLSLILIIGKYLTERKFGLVLNIYDLLKLSVFIIPSIGLVLFQPDLGTAGILLLMISVPILFTGVQKNLLIGFIVLFVISAPLVWNFVLKPYQKTRVISFIKPGDDPQGAGWNVIQSRIAIGSGRVFGKGFKKGTQNQLQFLPERHTDFIFSVLSEEYGFLGSCLTLSLFLFLIAFIFNLGRKARDRLSCYFCIGAGAFFLWHTSLNIAMTMGLFPVVGAPLPLLSYGGSHLLTTMAFLGLVAGVYRRKDLF